MLNHKFDEDWQWEVDELTAERDALLAALKEARFFVQLARKHGNMGAATAQDRVDAAIARAEGQT